MFNPSNLEAELTKAQELITRSKNTILGLQALVKTREEEISSHVAALDNAGKITDTVASIASKFQESFKDFETFLSQTANTTNTQFVDYPSEIQSNTLVNDSNSSSGSVNNPHIHIGPLQVKE